MATPIAVLLVVYLFNISALPRMCEGALLSDVIAINASVDIVMGEVDR